MSSRQDMPRWLLYAIEHIGSLVSPHMIDR
jgi:hypothetical protein